MCWGEGQKSSSSSGSVFMAAGLKSLGRTIKTPNATVKRKVSTQNDLTRVYIFLNYFYLTMETTKMLFMTICLYVPNGSLACAVMSEDTEHNTDTT